jgi:hypothetical protein
MATGQSAFLRSYAHKKDISEITIDLLSPKRPIFQSPITKTKEKHRLWLINALSKKKIEIEKLKTAEIRIEFSTFKEFPNAARDTRGEPYMCTVAITGENGVTYKTTKLGCCALHDPGIERRRAQANTQL